MVNIWSDVQEESKRLALLWFASFGFVEFSDKFSANLMIWFPQCHVTLFHVFFLKYNYITALDHASLRGTEHVLTGNEDGKLANCKEHDECRWIRGQKPACEAFFLRCREKMRKSKDGEWMGMFHIAKLFAAPFQCYHCFLPSLCQLK